MEPQVPKLPGYSVSIPVSGHSVLGPLCTTACRCVRVHFLSHSVGRWLTRPSQQTLVQFILQAQSGRSSQLRTACCCFHQTPVYVCTCSHAWRTSPWAGSRPSPTSKATPSRTLMCRASCHMMAAHGPRSPQRSAHTPQTPAAAGLQQPQQPQTQVLPRHAARRCPSGWSRTDRWAVGSKSCLGPFAAGVPCCALKPGLGARPDAQDSA